MFLSIRYGQNKHSTGIHKVLVSPSLPLSISLPGFLKNCFSFSLPMADKVLVLYLPGLVIQQKKVVFSDRLWFSGFDGMCILKPTTEEKRTGSPDQPGLVPDLLTARVRKNNFLIGKVMAIPLIGMDGL